MTRCSLPLLAVALLVARPLSAQSLERRISDIRDGSAQFSFASRPGVCGDGATYLRDGFGGDMRISEGGNFHGSRGDYDWAACVEGPVRVVASFADGQILRLRTYVGPSRRSSESDRRDLGPVSVGEAAAFLQQLMEQGRGRAASDAVLPLILADSIDPWPPLLRFARDERLPKSVRSSVAFWLARGAAFRLGVTDEEQSTDDDVRVQAVFALSQQPRESAVPRLIEIVRHSSRPVVRAQALFWLGQSGDPRAVDLFEEILRR